MKTKDFDSLKNTFEKAFSLKKSIDLISLEVMTQLDVSPDDIYRRDFDGISSAEFLIHKMIGELLIQGRINF